ncbi:ATP-binding cassette domain-containing protein [Streptomyces sp. 6N223]|uniref:ATP-binding cassette domain-containing protein n=1 Tax=Streptomyces sp. 6N223 TaxID=3457412 RepID=UPI003FD35C9A
MTPAPETTTAASARPETTQSATLPLLAIRATGLRKSIGVVSQANTLDRALSIYENLEFRGRYFGLRAATARARATELLDTFEVGHRATARPSELSGGQAQRVMIARALMHRPDVLFLDEPTTGVDPQSRLKVWEVLRNLHGNGQTILLTTHHMEEAETLCEEIAIVDAGAVLANGTVEELGKQVSMDTEVTCTYDGEAAPVAPFIAARPGVRLVTVDARRVRVRAAGPGGLVAALVEAGAMSGLTVQDVATRQTSLEDVFLKLTGSAYRDQ